eukprot:m.98895 g.98895  ORF g.98895 m.98895 type:complete len:354 (-) comp51427_c0_seq3:247-1308(-)
MLALVVFILAGGVVGASLLCSVQLGDARQQERVAAISSTWASSCDKLLFIGRRTPGLDRTLHPSVRYLPHPPTEHPQSFEATRRVWTFIAQVASQQRFDWLLLVNDETFVHVENLRTYLTTFDSSKPLYLGRTYTSTMVAAERVLSEPYNSITAGYLLNSVCLRAALAASIFSRPSVGTEVSKPGDAVLAQRLRALSIEPVPDSSDSAGGERFLPVSLEYARSLRQRKTPGYWYWALPASQPKEELACCASAWVTAGLISPERMTLYHQNLANHLDATGERLTLSIYDKNRHAAQASFVGIPWLSNLASTTLYDWIFDTFSTEPPATHSVLRHDDITVTREDFSHCTDMGLCM